MSALVSKAVTMFGLATLVFLALRADADTNPVVMLLAGLFFGACVWVPAAMRIAVGETNRRHELELRRLERRIRETPR